MTDIIEADLYSLAQRDLLIIITGGQKIYRRICILHIIQRLIQGFSASPRLPVSPLCL